MKIMIIKYFFNNEKKVIFSNFPSVSNKNFSLLLVKNKNILKIIDHFK